MRLHLLCGIIQLAGTVCRADLAGDVLREINFAREQPTACAQAIAQQHRQDHNPAADATVLEAIRFLEKTGPLPPLAWSPSLALSARSHVADAEKSGIVGHQGSDRSSAKQRMNRYGRVLDSGGENISFGYRTARSIVASLIIDEGVRGRGHRKNIFNPNFKLAGVAAGGHARYGSMCVIDFAAGFIPSGEPENIPLFR